MTTQQDLAAGVAVPQSQPPSQVDLNIVFTGLCSYAITPKGDRNSKPKATFIMPNSRQWRNSLNTGEVRIPPHRAFLIAREKDVAFDNGVWKGAAPTGRVAEKWVYWIFEDDNIFIDRLPKDGVTVANVGDVIHLPDLCSDAEVSNRCLAGPCPDVDARVIFESGRISQRSLTTEQYQFETCRGEVLGPKEIADEVQVRIRNVPMTRSGEIILQRVSLSDERDGRQPIILRPPREDRLIKIFFGSAPEVDLDAVVGRGPNHHHDTTNAHFELHYGVSRRRPFAPVPVPQRAREPRVTRIGPVAGTDRCPPASSSGSSSTGTR